MLLHLRPICKHRAPQCICPQTSKTVPTLPCLSSPTVPPHLPLLPHRTLPIASAPNLPSTVPPHLPLLPHRTLSQPSPIPPKPPSRPLSHTCKTTVPPPSATILLPHLPLCLTELSAERNPLSAISKTSQSTHPPSGPSLLTPSSNHDTPSLLTRSFHRQSCPQTRLSHRQLNVANQRGSSSSAPPTLRIIVDHEGEH
uniref:Uncharacterized protein n=1 Tax=Salix viminalis TaxID=40686 RepID=A0A6N2KQC0_SALVM